MNSQKPAVVISSLHISTRKWSICHAAVPNRRVIFLSAQSNIYFCISRRTATARTLWTLPGTTTATKSSSSMETTGVSCCPGLQGDFPVNVSCYRFSFIKLARDLLKEHDTYWVGTLRKKRKHIDKELIGTRGTRTCPPLPLGPPNAKGVQVQRYRYVLSSLKM